jgi:hypothetical protein
MSMCISIVKSKIYFRTDIYVEEVAFTERTNGKSEECWVKLTYL